jgi:putative OPT family oligopeptide transporter
MAEPTSISSSPSSLEKNAMPGPNSKHQPYVPDGVDIPEFTWPALVLGVFLGILFGASSLYLLLKVGMTVSASVPIAVLSITLFRALSRSFGFRRATILENNIVQTTGSAGESIAFGVGVTMPALLLLGFEMHWVRVMTVAVLGGLLGILMMIPLRRAFIVKQHGKLIYPEGTACAEVLIAGEKGGMTARMVFLGFGVALVHKFLTQAAKLWAEMPEEKLYGATGKGLKGAAISGELAPELLGVGYLIGPRVAALMMAGAVMSYWVVGPLIATFGEKLTEPVAPAQTQMEKGVDKGLIRNMGPSDIKAHYLRYIGAGAVAAGGIISMLRALPLILGSILAGLRDLRATRVAGAEAVARTERDLSLNVVLFGSLALVAALMFVPALGLGVGFQGLLGALMILLFGFLFVTVSSRLTGEVGSSSNPISGMTIATLLMTCLIFLMLGRIGPQAMLTALTVAAVVCIASSNGGTTSQDLKTGYLVGATPRRQQWAILIGALTSAVVIGATLLALNAAGTHYTRRNLPDKKLVVAPDAPFETETVGKPYAGEDKNIYRIVHVRENDAVNPGVRPGRYLVDAEGWARYRTDLAIQREAKTMDNGEEAPKGFSAPQPELFASLVKGILGGALQWGLVVLGVLITLALELAGVPALPFAVGMYIPLSSTAPIFVGGLLRWLADRLRGKSASETETETSPGVLLSSGYIAGGTLCGLVLAFFAFLPDAFNKSLNLGSRFLSESYAKGESPAAKITALGMFLVLAVLLLGVGSRKTAVDNGTKEGASG